MFHKKRKNNRYTGDNICAITLQSDVQQQSKLM